MTFRIAVLSGFILVGGCHRNSASTDDMATVLDLASASDLQPELDSSVASDLASNGTGHGTSQCIPDATLGICIIDQQHSTVQAALDDPACATVCLSARTFTENLVATHAVVVTGSGVGATIIDGGGAGTTLALRTAGAVTLHGLELTNGHGGDGGCLYSQAQLTLDAVRVAGCSASQRGGGIYQVGGSITLQAGTIVEQNSIAATTSSNVVPYYGGGGMYVDGSTALVQGSTIRTNTVSVAATDVAAPSGGGGGVAVDNGTLTLMNAVVDQNVVTVSSRITGVDSYGGGVFGHLSSITVSGGTKVTSNVVHAPTSFGGQSASAHGGGLALVGGTCSMSSSTVATNVANSDTNPAYGCIDYAEGGAVCVTDGTLTADGVDFSSNQATATSNFSADVHGGGLSLTNSTVTLTHSSVDSNQAVASVLSGTWGSIAGAGGIASYGTTGTAKGSLEIRASTISNNVAQAGTSTSAAPSSVYAGGIAIVGDQQQAQSSLLLVDATVSTNHARALGTGATYAEGGGITVYANTGTTSAVDLRNATITANTVQGTTTNRGGGLMIERTSTGATISVSGAASIVAGNTAGASPDCYTLTPVTFTSGGYDLFGDVTGCSMNGDTTGNLVGVDPKLGPLADNGGLTMTQALASDSPAVNAGTPGGCSDGTATLTTDQRGAPRPSGTTGVDRCDIGAYEL